MGKKKHNVFVDDKVWVRRKRCATCIFGKNSPVVAARREQMVADADEADGCIPCHKHIHQGERIEPVCNGYFNVNQSILLRLAESMRVIEWYDDE